MRCKITEYGQVILFLLLLTLSVNPLCAQTTQQLTVHELFERGIENSIKIKSLQVNVNIARHAEAAAKISRLPSVELNVVGGYLGDPTLFAGNGLTNPTHTEIPNWQQNYDVLLTQPIFRGGKIKYNIEKAALQKDIALLDVERDKAEIKLLLIGRYLSLFKLYKEKDVLAENIKEAQQRLHDIKGMRKEGMITTNDVLRSELELTNYELALRETDDNIEIVSQQLDIALGIDEATLLLPDTAELNIERAILPYEQYVDDAYKQYPDLQVALSKTALAEKNLKIAQADYLPSLMLRAGNNLDRPILKTSPPLDNFMNSWNVSLVLSYNLSSLYQNKQNVSISRENISFQKLQEEQLKRDIRSNLKAAYIKHKEAIDRVGILHISLKQANENYRIVQNKYFNQLAVLTDLLDATTVKLRTEMQLTEAKANAAYTYYQLLKASGNL